MNLTRLISLTTAMILSTSCASFQKYEIIRSSTDTSITYFSKRVSKPAPKQIYALLCNLSDRQEQRFQSSIAEVYKTLRNVNVPAENVYVISQGIENILPHKYIPSREGLSAAFSDIGKRITTNDILLWSNTLRSCLRDRAKTP